MAQRLERLAIGRLTLLRPCPEFGELAQRRIALGLYRIPRRPDHIEIGRPPAQFGERLKRIAPLALGSIARGAQRLHFRRLGLGGGQLSGKTIGLAPRGEPPDQSPQHQRQYRDGDQFGHYLNLSKQPTGRNIDRTGAREQAYSAEGPQPLRILESLRISMSRFSRLT